MYGIEPYTRPGPRLASPLSPRHKIPIGLASCSRALAQSYSRWQPVSKFGAASGVLRAHVKSLPGTLEFRLRLVLLELTKRRPRVRKRIQPMRVEETRVNTRG